jgi:hypothetical protein
MPVAPTSPIAEGGHLAAEKPKKEKIKLFTL